MSSGRSYTTQTWLGFPDAKLCDSEAPDAYSSFLGGSPVFFGQHSCNPELLRCGRCKEYMQFVLQCYSPLEGDDTKERALYIWMCHNASCKRNPEGVRCLRGERLLKNTEQETKESPQKTKDLSTNVAQKPTFVNPFSAPSSNATEFANPFCSSSTQQLSNPFLSSTSQKTPFSQIAAKHATKKDPVVVHETQSAKRTRFTNSFTYPEEIPQFPGTYIAFDKEVIPIKQQGKSKKEKQLMLDATADPSDWGQEGYEKSPAVFEKAFRQFTERIAFNPQQCVRYERGGAALLSSFRDQLGSSIRSALNGNKNPFPNCRHCNSPRVFELQLVPQTISLLDDMVSEWTSVLVATCAMDCLPSVDQDMCGFVDEWVGIQFE
ncbi:programmed cell death protein [Schizosaccharomyces japonicus yFS275]|uniref:Programmed cell death protein n=1 Tax=Schizosaccharomyces japonicus (strain yFS275 / FY16936) TaxID=402676 RepID=B6K1I1_SCHJY|nr:programmed cell death protein [Schizosaccharomyces japonicus yFS275]EEB07802.1 programmed cell death protein [Schizosaccharomyces japonicus yFS275]